MKAVRYYGKEDIRVEQTAEPGAIGAKQVRIKPRTCGICGTDLHEFAAGPIVTPVSPHVFTGASLPQILGHEFSAEVIEAGKEVTRVKAGDRISIQPLVMPLDDYYSRRGLNHLSPRMGCIGLSWALGGMGELAVINDYNANVIPDTVSDEQGALIEPTAVALYGVDRAKVGGGTTVLITGAGLIGALAVLCSYAVGASRIFVSEPNANRRRHIEKPRHCRPGHRSACRGRHPQSSETAPKKASVSTRPSNAPGTKRPSTPASRPSAIAARWPRSACT